MRIAVFDSTTGRIDRVLDCSESQIAINVRQGEAYLEVPAGVQDDTHYVENGQAVAAPAKPSSVHTFDYGQKAWVDARSLQQVRDAQWATVKRARSEAEFGGFVWDGSTFDSDPLSQSRIQGAAQLAQLALAQNQAFTIDWTLADNTVRTLDATEMISVGMAMGTHISTQHAIGRGLRTQIQAGASTAEIEAVLWP